MSACPIADAQQRILVISDSHASYACMRGILDEAHCRIACVPLADALAALSQHAADMIILDVQDQIEDYAHLCQSFVEAHPNDDAPRFVAVKPAHLDHIEAFMNAGATDFLVYDESNLILCRHRLHLALKSLAENNALKLHQARHNHAHRVARIGHWDWDVVNHNLYWSDEIYELVNVEKGQFSSNNAAFLSTLYDDDIERIKLATHNSLKHGAPYSLEHRVKRADGKRQYVSQHAELIRDSSGDIIGLRGIMQDITERYLAHEKIQHQAYHDALTGLPNRLLFHDRLTHALDLHQRTGSLVAILFIDLDRFKAINDNLGHKVGDKFLAGLANNLKQKIRSCDTLARLGGDEFAVIVENIQDETVIETVANHLIDALALPVSVEGHDLFGFASIGIAVTPEAGIKRDDLIRRADIAMYSAKEMGGHQYCYYTEDMTMHACSRLSMEKELRDAIHNEQLIVHYQPKVCVNSGQIRGMEALVRWEHPERGMISPADFIPLAEKTGLIVDLGQWVLRTACAQTVQWHHAGFSELTISVNVSVKQFNSAAFYDDVVGVLDDTGIDPARLDLEITETCTIANIDRTVALLKKLRDLGVSISLDDFGTGFSSLSFLNQLPLDALKVDRSFIRNIEGAGTNGELARLIIDIAASLHLNVVAEGVETETQLDFLKTNGCREYQGFYLSPPVSSDQLSQLLYNDKGCDAPVKLAGTG